MCAAEKTKTRMSNPQSRPNSEVVVEYHEQTKHHFGRFAPSLGYMDWATQPNPFRRFPGARPLRLPRPETDYTPPYDQIYHPERIPPQPVTLESLSAFFFYSMALSAWKVYQTNRWSLRVNPSSGNLHPTEAYLLAAGVPGLDDEPGVHHYAPDEHVLERRAVFDKQIWQHLTEAMPVGAMLIGLTSIHWRESWKYGERAYRYCQHDAGHALAALCISATILGWRLDLLPRLSDEQIEKLLGLTHSAAWYEQEPERPDLLAAVIPSKETFDASAFEPPADAVSAVASARWFGQPNQLSQNHHSWQLIERVDRACRKNTGWPRGWRPPQPHPLRVDKQACVNVSAGRIIRQRRSALAMDGQTCITAAELYRTLTRVMPTCTKTPWCALPWPPFVHLGLFIHRIQDIPRGLYLLVRNAEHHDELRIATKQNFAWEKPPQCPDDLPLYLLLEGDARRLATQVSCGQEIAGDSAFSLGMLVRFEDTLRQHGAFLYRHLFWETGVIGQVLYLEAEAMGIRSTGIGCFFDDPVHDVFGLRGFAFQSLYHFTIGGAVEDPRLTSEPPYSEPDGA